MRADARQLAAEAGGGAIDDQVEGRAVDPVAAARMNVGAELFGECPGLVYGAVGDGQAGGLARCTSGSSIPRTAPPAPNTSTRRPAISSPRLFSISRTIPAPSVLSPEHRPVMLKPQRVDRLGTLRPLAQPVSRLAA